MLRTRYSSYYAGGGRTLTGRQGVRVRGTRAAATKPLAARSPGRRSGRDGGPTDREDRRIAACAVRLYRTPTLPHAAAVAPGVGPLAHWTGRAATKGRRRADAGRSAMPPDGGGPPYRDGGLVLGSERAELAVSGRHQRIAQERRQARSCGSSRAGLPRGIRR
ncbi:hypothetical protein THAOC_08921 [Thalassiosira oceanica]|uniref:Uncharacterized protein n=1 Tax=Thalassiosira oceanica TaxID=159749 RepID=K0T8U4_THAOC|nr:hypothetical protein THAOC_08921 [Thalassiosira oceanica]|eukprot:EJK69786.1 hypothetical protein THAOC_08921 [Thalassiosira oceanica]